MLVVIGAVGLGTAIAGGIRRLVQIRKEWKLGDKADAEAKLAQGRDRREQERHDEQLAGIRAKQRLDEANAELAETDKGQIRQEMHIALSEAKIPISDSQGEAAAAALEATAGSVVYNMPTLRSVTIEAADSSELIDLAS